jgi:signal transduction histidine kinase
VLFTAVGAGLVALVAGIGLSWRLTRPLRELTVGVNTLSTGELGQQVLVAGAEEMRVLAQAFNTMSRRLADLEQARQHMSSDIAHELRSPVSVLRGHLEAMMDGVYPLDSAHVAVAYDQTLHLARLVEDLRLLTQAEAGRLSLNRQVLQPGVLVEQAVARFEPLVQDAEFNFSHTVAPNLSEIWVDSGRMQQVFDNLLTNALRHTTPGGEIAIDVVEVDDMVRYVVSNTGSIASEQLAHIFERFWRADEARRRDVGGSGLGMAITQQLVLLHGGRIWVESTDGQACFMIELPKHK